ncbi:hypothetical protein EBR21_13645, partial [bacterium]|nr:hypothetical protein [bacterium]
MPLPPHQLVFPWQLKSNGSAPRAKPIAQTSGETNPVILKAADGTPMAFAMSSQPPVVYLRTGGAAPNGELGRWGKWAGMWSLLASRLKDKSPMLSVVQLKTPEEWTGWFQEQKRLQNPGFRYIIDGQNLKGRILSDRTAALEPQPALYIRERDDHMVLFEPPHSERVSEPLSTSEIEQLFPHSQPGRKSESRESSNANAMQWFGGLLALISAVVLWLLQFRKGHQLAAGKVSALMLALLSAGIATPHAMAESSGRLPIDARASARFMGNRPEISSHPFR